MDDLLDYLDAMEGEDRNKLGDLSPDNLIQRARLLGRISAIKAIRKQVERLEE